MIMCGMIYKYKFKIQDMDTQTSKIELAKLILELEDPKLINKIHELLLDEGSKFRKGLTEFEKEEIQLGLEQLNRGERISFEDFMKKVYLSP